MTAWMDAVKKALATLKKKDPKATLGQAMKEAKKTYTPATPKAKKEKDRSVSPMS